MIEKFQNILITTIISVFLIGSYDYYKESIVTKNEEFIVFSAKNIIEHKKLQIKKAILNNENIQNKEKELEEIIKSIDILLEDLSIVYHKPIFQKEMVLSGNTKDITPLIEKSLISKGLL
jgi:DNA polymerase III delta prime subunit